MIFNILSVIAGFVFLFAGGESLVRGAVSVAARLGLSTMLVGLVIVGFGTSAPELMVSLEAAFKGTPDIALGNVVGSNIANIFLILGVAAVIHPVSCTGLTVRRDALAVIAASLLLAAFSFTQALDLLEGVLLVSLLVFYMGYSYYSETKKKKDFLKRHGAKKEAKEISSHMEEDFEGNDKVPMALLFVGIGMGALVLGAGLLVDGATALARAAGVSEAVIGLTLVALGTSLPELATAIVAATKKHADVLIGNVLGSNLFNILSILGITALVAPIPFAGRIAEIDVWIMLAVAVILYGLIRIKGEVSRPAGIVFLLSYVIYCGWLFQTG